MSDEDDPIFTCVCLAFLMMATPYFIVLMISTAWHFLSIFVEAIKQ